MRKMTLIAIGLIVMFNQQEMEAISVNRKVTVRVPWLPNRALLSTDCELGIVGEKFWCTFSVASEMEALICWTLKIYSV